MNTAVKPNLVHESESQRQYARVKIPAKLMFKLNGVIKRHKLADISAGGFAFYDTDKAITKSHYVGHIEFCIEGFSFVLPVQFDAKIITQEGRVGCCFQGMSPTEIASLRHIIAAFLSGELVTTGDMLNILSRENFTKARANKLSQGLSGIAKLKAVAGSIAFFAIGLLAFAFVVTKVSGVVFVAKSTSAEVVADTYTLTTPREGVVKLNVSVGDRVHAGDILGSFSSPLFSYLSDTIGLESLTTEAIKQVNEQSYSGGLISPCDCIVEDIVFPTGGYATKGEQILQLVPVDVKPHLEATFDMRDYSLLNPGDSITFNVAGTNIKSTITRVKAVRDAQGNLRDLLSVIATSDTKDLSNLIGLPAQAKVNRLSLN